MSLSLISLLLNGASLQTLINAAEELLGNPVAFIDRNQNEPLLSPNYPQDDIDDKIYRRRNITMEEYQKDTEYVTALSLTGQPHIIAWPNIRRKRMICGSIVGGRHLGGVRLPDVGRPLEEIDRNMVIQTAQVMGIALILNGWPVGLPDNDGQSFLWSILNQKVNPSFLSNRMIYPLFPDGCSFCMLWYSCETENFFLPDGISYCYAPVENGFAVLTDFQALSKGKDAFDREIRSRHFLVSCSDVFWSVNDIYQQFQLAKSVHAYASVSGQVEGLAWYNDYRLYHMLDAVSKTAQASSYIHDGLRQLREYDREKGTEYLPTLRTYLECNQNVGQTAANLCIHKNTVFYRLGRLKTDFGLDLQDTKTLVSLYCSLKLLPML